MAEPFLLRPWEIADLTDKQIRMMIAGQKKATDAIRGDDGPKAFDEPEGERITDKGFVTEAEAKAFFADVDREIYGV